MRINQQNFVSFFFQFFKEKDFKRPREGLPYSNEGLPYPNEGYIRNKKRRIRNEAYIRNKEYIRERDKEDF